MIEIISLLVWCILSYFQPLIQTSRTSAPSLRHTLMKQHSCAHAQMTWLWNTLILWTWRTMLRRITWTPAEFTWATVSEDLSWKSVARSSMLLVLPGELCLLKFLSCWRLTPSEMAWSPQGSFLGEWVINSKTNITLKVAIQDFFYNLLAVPQFVTNTYALVARAQSYADHTQHIGCSSCTTCVSRGRKGQLCC